MPCGRIHPSHIKHIDMVAEPQSGEPKLVACESNPLAMALVAREVTVYKGGDKRRTGPVGERRRFKITWRSNTWSSRRRWE